MANTPPPPTGVLGDPKTGGAGGGRKGKYKAFFKFPPFSSNSQPSPRNQSDGVPCVSQALARQKLPYRERASRKKKTRKQILHPSLKKKDDGQTKKNLANSLIEVR